MQNLLPLVIVNGLIDSFNPCAIAILLLFISVTFMLVEKRRLMLLIGASYILSVYFTYLLIGLGFLKIAMVFNIPHFGAKVGAWLVIFVGIIGLKDFYFPNFLPKLNLRITIGNRQKISEWVYKASIPAAIITGFLVGIFEFPCSGAVYMATLALLASNVTYSKGFTYLLIYNLLFIFPLIVIYLVATNRNIVEKYIYLQEKNASIMRFINAISMLIIGLVILIFFS